MASPVPLDDASAAAAATTPLLSFTSWNDDNETTIILLHGGFTCRLEFEHVVPHLSDFHVLVPDLPLHSASRHIKPGTTEHSALHVARLIQSHAHNGKAHVVGVSMGGYIGQCLALEQPDLVLSLFVTGAAPVVGARLFMARWPSFTYFNMTLMLSWLPGIFKYQSSSMGMNISDELIAEMRDNNTWELMQDMFPWILKFTLDDVRQLKVRTLSIAAAKGDDVPTIEKTGEALRSRRTAQGEPWPEDGSAAIILREATHGWDMQFPELFGRAVSAWINKEELPVELEKI